MDDFKSVYVKDIPLKGKGIFAAVPIVSESLILPFLGTVVPLSAASKLSLQIDFDKALESLSTIDDFLNHSCEPNAKVVMINSRYFLYAICDIEQHEEITFDYNTTEYDLISQDCSFICRCGESSCLGEIKGFKHLLSGQYAKIRDLCIPYLRKNYGVSS